MILCVGSYVPNEIEYSSLSVSSAGNRFQLNMWSALKYEGNSLIGSSYIGVDIDDSALLSLNQDSLNMFDDISFFLKKSGLLRSIVNMYQYVNNKISRCECIICYNIVYSWMFVPFLAKRKGVKCILVLADQSEENSYRNPIRKLYAKLQKFVIKRFDSVIGLSENTRKLIKPSQKFMLMEGGIDSFVYDYFTEYRDNNSGCVTYMYSGLLDIVTGVDLLLDAIRICDLDNVKFVFSGKGPLSEFIIEMARKDSRVEYRGNLTYKDYLEVLRCADILINPRNMILPENMNNFPSKIMDYLATGKKIISTKFVGWDKFTKYISFVESDANSIANALNSCSISRYEEYEANREFAQNFLWDNQVKRICDEIIRA